MKRLFLFLIVALLTTGMSAQQIEKLQLYDGSDKAELFVYLPDNQVMERSGILICPGGAYAMLAIDNEGFNMARWYVSKGMVAAVLKYRLPHGDYTIPLSDAEKAMELMKTNAQKWHLNADCIGVAGSSAGGHLAASLSTLAADANRPAFSILYYPVISFDDAVTHSGSKENLLGKRVKDAKMVQHFTLQEQVDEKTPPALILVSDDDSLVPVENSVLYYQALHQHKIPAALYIFPNGEHGWGTTERFLYKNEVKDLIYLWLVHNKFLEK